MEALFNAIEVATSQSEPHNSSRGANSKGGHTCQICGRTYERGDHLNRHLKTHENARQYKCRLCTKRFNRADLLSRHQQNHARAPNYRRDGSERASSACIACVTSKSKCQDQKPCTRCQKKNIPCEDQAGQVLGPTVSSTTQYHSIPQGTHIRSFSHNADITTRPDSSETIGNDTTFENGGHNDELQQLYPISTAAFEADLSITLAQSSNMFENEYQEHPSEDSNFQFFDQDLGFFARDFHFGNEVDLSTWQFDLTEFMTPPEDTSNLATFDKVPHSESSGQTKPSKGALKRYAAFERSPWLWNPTSKDHALHDETNLDVEETVSVTLSPSTEVDSLAQLSFCCIDSVKRDQILHMLYSLRLHRPPIRAFPPLALLNLAIRVYFAQARMGIDTIIHLASFNPKTAMQQLLLAIISAGATSISTPSVWKMGLVFQELVRHTVGELWEENNSYTRNLEVIQAFTIMLDVGLWSGIKRTMEIAESFCQPIIVMLRRMGAFSPVKGNSSAIPTAADSHAVLQAKWEAFIKQESFKRLVLHLFIHDTQASVGYQKPCLLSFTEIQLELPVSSDLWLAESATKWRDIYMSKLLKSVPTVPELMHNPELLIAVEGQVDIKLTAMVIIEGYWGQIWRLTESRKFYPQDKPIYQLAMITEKDELYRNLTSTIAKLKDLYGNNPTLDLLAEFFMMVSHVSPDDLQRYAGKYGPQESRKSSEDFQNWFKTPTSRTAVWHAGQVLRFAKSFTPTQLKGFYGVVVYYAVLTLWTYGKMSRISREVDVAPGTLPTPKSQGTSEANQTISLNNDTTNVVVSFKIGNGGTPGLTMPCREGDVEFCPLEDVNRILWYGGWLYKHNFFLTDEPLPPLLETLGELMSDLGSSPPSRASRMASEALG